MKILSIGNFGFGWDGSINREKNLRICTTLQNTRNRSKQSNNKSGFIGVHWSKRKQRWIARVDIGTKVQTTLHEDLTEAAKSRDRLAVKYFGEYAKLNFPEVLK